MLNERVISVQLLHEHLRFCLREMLCAFAFAASGFVLPDDAVFHASPFVWIAGV
jgi:hypothetical protein